MKTRLKIPGLLVLGISLVGFLQSQVLAQAVIDKANALFHAGREHQRKAEDARELYKPGQPETFGNWQTFHDETEEAIRCFRGTVALSPFWNYYSHLGQSSYDLGLLGESRLAWERALTLTEDSLQDPKPDAETLALIHANVAELSQVGGDYAKAIQHYRAAGRTLNRNVPPGMYITFCRDELKLRANLPQALAKAEGRSRDLDLLTHPPRTYGQLSVTKGQLHAQLACVFRYEGVPENRGRVESRMREIMASVERFYGANGVDLHVDFAWDQPPTTADTIRPSAITIYDHWPRPPARTGELAHYGEYWPADTLHWPVLSSQGQSMTVETAAHGVAHEIGHYLGLNHWGEARGDIMGPSLPMAHADGHLSAHSLRHLLGLLIPKEEGLDRLREMLRTKPAEGFLLLEEACENDPDAPEMIEDVARDKGLAQAIELLTQAISWADQHGRVRYVMQATYWRALAEERIGKQGDAVADYSRILDIPGHLVWANLGQVRVMKKGVLTQIGPEDLHAHIARLCMDLGRRAEAQLHLKKAMESGESGTGEFTGSPAGLILLAQTALDLGEKDLARKKAAEALAAEPANADAFALAVKLSEDKAEPYSIRANAWMKRRNTAEALKNVRQAISLGGTKVDSRLVFLLARTLLENKEYEEAIADLTRAIEAEKGGASLLVELLSARGLAYVDSGKPDLGLADLSEAISLGHAGGSRTPGTELGPGVLNALLGRVRLELARGQTEDALNDLKKARSGLGCGPDVMVALGQVYEKLGKVQDARAEYRAALQDWPEFAQAFDALVKSGEDKTNALLYRGLAKAGAIGRTGQYLPPYRMKLDCRPALADLDEAIRLKPDFREAYVWRGNVHAALGEQDEAEADRSKAKELEAAATRPATPTPTTTGK